MLISCFNSSLPPMQHAKPCDKTAVRKLSALDSSVYNMIEVFLHKTLTGDLTRLDGANVCAGDLEYDFALVVSRGRVETPGTCLPANGRLFQHFILPLFAHVGGAPEF